MGLTDSAVEVEVNRRGFLVLSGSALASLSAGGTAIAQQVAVDEFTAIAWLIGPEANIPDPDGSFFENITDYHYVYWAENTGARFEIQEGDEDWTEMPTHLPGYPFSNLPTSPTTGSLFFDENRNLPTWWDQDHYEYPNFVDDVKVSPVTIANTTTRTTVFDPDINANSLVKGRKYQIQLSGSFGTANNSDSFAVDVNLGGATDLAGIGNVPANATNVPWWVQIEFSVREDGPNGMLVPTTLGMFNGEAQQATEAHSPVSVDTTTVTELSVDIQWDAASADNTVTVDQAHLVQMG